MQMERQELHLLAVPGRQGPMAAAMLHPEQVRLVSQFDTKAKKGDVAGAYLGQDPRLLWAKKGLDKFQKQLKISK